MGESDFACSLELICQERKLGTGITAHISFKNHGEKYLYSRLIGEK
jgi:hypothetical protein